MFIQQFFATFSNSSDHLDNSSAVVVKFLCKIYHEEAVNLSFDMSNISNADKCGNPQKEIVGKEEGKDSQAPKPSGFDFT